ncbi:MAG: hypothetical protein GY722_08300 [bacterium]|nr:hypothetical protein [bacterium]
MRPPNVAVRSLSVFYDEIRNGRQLNWGQLMQVGWNRARRKRAARHLRFIVLAVALTGINIWLWARISSDVADNTATGGLELALTAVASAATLFAIVYLWRNPLNHNVQMMSTPALRQALATHHAGHVAAAHIEDPTRVRRTDLLQPCNLHAAEIPAVTQSALRAEMTVALAGLTAEEIFAGESGSHAAGDLVHATDIGIDMVGLLGMTGSLVSLGTARQRRSHLVNKVLDDARARKELEALMREIKRDTVRTMLESRHVIVAIRDALMRHTRLDAGELRDIIAKADQIRHSDDEVLVDLRIVSNRPAVGEM